MECKELKCAYNRGIKARISVPNELDSRVIQTAWIQNLADCKNNFAVTPYWLPSKWFTAMIGHVWILKSTLIDTHTKKTRLVFYQYTSNLMSCREAEDWVGTFRQTSGSFHVTTDSQSKQSCQLEVGFLNTLDVATRVTVHVQKYR